MADGWSAAASVERERALEHLFLGELSSRILLETGRGPEILKSEHDSYGYDVVIELAGFLRHLQLKVGRHDGERAHLDINMQLAMKPSGCVIWAMVDPATYRLGPFYWFGGLPGEPLPDLGDRSVRHSRANRDGVKAVRPGLRRLPKGRLERLDTIEEVILRLFGSPRDRLLRQHLLSRPPEFTIGGDAWLLAVKAGFYGAIPGDLSFEQTIGLAHLVDGYALALAAGLGDGFAFADQALAQAESMGDWSGDALELWASLFLEHRRDRFAGAPPDRERLRLLDLLVARLRARLLARR